MVPIANRREQFSRFQVVVPIPEATDEHQKPVEFLLCLVEQDGQGLRSGWVTRWTSVQESVLSQVEIGQFLFAIELRFSPLCSLFPVSSDVSPPLFILNGGSVKVFQRTRVVVRSRRFGERCVSPFGSAVFPNARHQEDCNKRLLLGIIRLPKGVQHVAAAIPPRTLVNGG